MVESGEMEVLSEEQFDCKNSGNSNNKKPKFKMKMVPREELMIKKINPEIKNRNCPKMSQDGEDHLKDM